MFFLVSGEVWRVFESNLEELVGQQQMDQEGTLRLTGRQEEAAD